MITTRLPVRTPVQRRSDVLRFAWVMGAGVLALGACGSDDSSSTTAPVTALAPATTGAPGSTSATPATLSTTAGPATTAGNGDGGTGTVSAGTLTLVADGLTIDAEITSCSESGETQVSITAEGDTSSITVTPSAGNTVDVTTTGAFEFEGNGTAVVSDVGGVTVTGTGSSTTNGGAASDFTLTAQISGC